MPHSNSARTVSSAPTAPPNELRSHRPRRTLVPARREAGMSIFGWLVVLFVVGFVLNIGLTLGPHYVDNRSIVGLVDGMSPEVWRGTNIKRMHEAVDKGLKVNNIRSLKSTDVLQIERTQTMTKVNVDYEVRENLFGNIDVVLVFKKDYQF